MLPSANYCAANTNTFKSCGGKGIKMSVMRNKIQRHTVTAGRWSQKEQWAFRWGANVYSKTRNRRGREFIRYKPQDLVAVAYKLLNVHKKQMFGRTWVRLYDNQEDKKSHQDFNAIYRQSGGRTMLRLCEAPSTCTYSTLFYKRHQGSFEFDPYNLMLKEWDSVNNRFHDDFDLYKSYEDVISGAQPFRYCSFGGAGFPKSCGLTEAVNGEAVSAGAASPKVPRFSMWALEV